MLPRVFTPTDNISERDSELPSLFLAGSIEMGNADNWQAKVITELQSTVNVFNPRREDWDSSCKQEFSDPQFFQQVSWELDALDKADAILLYFDPNTKSPISLLELGLHAKSKKLVVICPDGFWRKGNVDIVCNRYDIPLFNSLEKAIERFKRM